MRPVSKGFGPSSRMQGLPNLPFKLVVADCELQRLAVLQAVPVCCPVMQLKTRPTQQCQLCAWPMRQPGRASPSCNRIHKAARTGSFDSSMPISIDCSGVSCSILPCGSGNNHMIMRC